MRSIQLLGAMLMCLAVSAQNSRFEGKKILEVRYEPSQQPLATRDLDRVQLLHSGEPLQSADVSETIDRMFATGRYADIQADVEEQNGGVIVRFITRDKRFIGHVGTVGKESNPPNQGQIVSVTNLNLGTEFGPELLHTAEQNVRQLFQSNGLYGAQVSLETVDDPATQQVNVLIHVKPGKRARYEEPVILGDTKLPDSTIIRATGWRIRFIGRWRQVTQQLTRKGVDGVEKAYDNKDRLAATVDLKSMEYDEETKRAKATLEIHAGEKITVKALETKVSKRLLKRYVPIYQEGAVDRDLLVEGARNLRDHFQTAGYADVDVTFRELPPANDERVIEYFINRGTRRKLTHLEIHGNTVFDEDTLRDHMFLEPSSWRYRNGRFSEALLKKDEQAITRLYLDKGYRDVKVASTIQDDYQGKANSIAVTISVDEGPLWTVAHLDFVGLQHMTPEDALALIQSREGQPYSDLGVVTDRTKVLNKYHSDGFRRASFEWKSNPSGQPHEVNLVYTIKEGQQEFVRDLLVSGLKTTRRDMVMRTMGFGKGDPLSFDRIRDSQKSLYDLGVFAKVNTAVQNSNGNETQKYVLYDFEEAHRYTVTVGVGAELARLGGTSSNLNTPAGGTGFTPRLSVDVSRLNFWGLGHTMDLQTRLSTLDQKLALSYTDPRLYGHEGRSLTFTTLYDLSRDVRTFSSRREEASVQLSQKVSKPDTLLFRFAYRRVSTNDVVIPDLLVPQLLQPVRIGIASMNWVDDHRDNPADAHKGIYNTVDVGLASGAFGSQRNFTRFLVRNATYHQIGKKRNNVVLARQLTIGAILPFRTLPNTTAADYVPLPERFYGGGSLSHRGFPENQAGPRDLGTPAGPGGTATPPTGFPLGGNAQFFSNIELRFPLIGDNIGGVIFHDAGNVYSGIGAISFRSHQRDAQDFGYMIHAVGFGIRYKTPVGPVRADFAYSINPPHFVGFKGTLQDLLSCNPHAAPGPNCQSVSQGISHFQFFFSIGQTF